MSTQELAVIQNLYGRLKHKHEQARANFKRPITLAEKILASHMAHVLDEDGAPLVRRLSYAQFYPDRVAMQDATAQMALLQFINADKAVVAVPSTVHCDHLIQARTGAMDDLKFALENNREVYDFLQSVCQKYGLGFWKPGSGIIHQVVLENYAFPGGMMIGTDSHTPNAGGLGMVAIGVGGADAADVMLGEPFVLRWPGVIGVELTGKLSGWASAKDVILKLMGILTVKGGTGCIVEFFGEGAKTLSATGKGTIANMGAEHGATTSIFPYDNTMGDYLRATGRESWAKLADKHAHFLQADPEVYAKPETYFDRVIRIDLSTLEPHIVGPHTPDLSRPISAIKQAVTDEHYPDNLKAALVGSCTNSSYEDIGRAASIAKFAVDNGMQAKIPFYVTPGSESVHSTIKRDGQMALLNDMGAVVLANACGPCIGQWYRTDVEKGETNAIISSYNRNFPGRNDGSRFTLSFLASPEIVTAIALSGKLSFNPLTDTLTAADGSQKKIPAPSATALPADGFQVDLTGYVQPAEDGKAIKIAVSPTSDRIALLERFAAWDGKDFVGMPILAKAKGKCTTDHISPAGQWLKYRGHLDKIANNTYIGVVNAFADEVGKGLDVTDNAVLGIPDLARRYKEKGIGWVFVGDENVGEGSSREHAAMQPRHLGGKAIIAKSFARIHETNLKKHGILPLTLTNPADYDKFGPKDRVDVVGLANLAPKQPVKVIIHHPDGSQDVISCQHTYSADQLLWFKAGSALNYLALRNAKKGRA